MFTLAIIFGLNLAIVIESTAQQVNNKENYTKKEYDVFNLIAAKITKTLDEEIEKDRKIAKNFKDERTAISKANNRSNLQHTNYKGKMLGVVCTSTYKLDYCRKKIGKIKQKIKHTKLNVKL